MYLKELIVKNIVDIYPHVAKMQNEQGKIMNSANKFSTYNQHASYCFAFLYAYDTPCNPYYHDQETLMRAIRGWDFYYTLTNEDGLTVLYTNDRHWSNTCERWGMYYWMNTMELLGGSLPADKAVAWHKRIHDIAGRIKSEIKSEVESDQYLQNLGKDTRNLFIWHVLTYYRYGMLYNDIDAMKYASGVMEDILSVQQPAGTWFEGGTLVAYYAGISLCAVSLFECFSKNTRAENAVRKGLDYVLNTIYPDLTRIDCIDGRNRYNKQACLGYTAPTFYKYREGTAYLSGLASLMEGACGEYVRDLHSFTVVAHIASVIPDEIRIDYEDIRKYIPETTDYSELKVKIVRKDDWVLPFCCLEQKELDNRWILYRQNLYSIYHKKTGLLVGGGHSIAQPQFSCF